MSKFYWIVRAGNGGVYGPFDGAPAAVAFRTKWRSFLPLPIDMAVMEDPDSFSAYAETKCGEVIQFTSS